MFCISDAFIDGDRIRGSIHNVVDKAFESGIKMSSCRYKNHSITLDVSFEPEGGFDKLLLEILNPYIGEDGFIKECGLRKVHTEEHGDFCIILYHNPSEVMALRAFYYNSKKE